MSSRTLLVTLVLPWLLVGLSSPKRLRPPLPWTKSPAPQRAAVLDYLTAVASGDPQQIALAIHPDDLLALRMRILGLLHEEAKRDDSTIRARLFGQGMPLAEIERLTNTGFYAVLSDRLYLSGREYSEVEGLAAIADKADAVHHHAHCATGRSRVENGRLFASQRNEQELAEAAAESRAPCAAQGDSR